MRRILGLTLSVFAVAGSFAAQPLFAASSRPPNFILIMADDLGYGDIGPFGSKVNRTPQLDRMAKEGMRLTSFYAAPVCTPSRAQVLTGCYAKRVSLPNVIFPASAIGLSAEEHTIASLLKSRGYATMAVGKWHVGDAPEFLPVHRGFDHYFGLPYSNDMGPKEQEDTKADLTKKRKPPLPLVRDDRVIETVAPKDQNRLTERYTEEAVGFIRENKDKPFFLYLPHTAVHVPIHPGQKFQGQAALPFNDWVEELDWSVGRVLDAVRELGLEKNTLVIFTSDNGPWLPMGKNAGIAGPLRGGKGSTYEGGVREPTLAWWPGKISAGSSCDAVAANYDFLPTFVTLAGGTVPNDRKLDGKDISPLLLAKEKSSPHEAHYYFNGNTLQALRSGPWKLAVVRRSGEGDTAIPFTPRLYNLDTEIGEQTDVAAQNPKVVERLQKLVAQMEADLGAGTNLGPGVRPPGRVENPIGLWLPGQGPTKGVQ
jgi:arylsulfatase A